MMENVVRIAGGICVFIGVIEIIIGAIVSQYFTNVHLGGWWGGILAIVGGSVGLLHINKSMVTTAAIISGIGVFVAGIATIVDSIAAGFFSTLHTCSSGGIYNPDTSDLFGNRVTGNLAYSSQATICESSKGFDIDLSACYCTTSSGICSEAYVPSPQGSCDIQQYYNLLSVSAGLCCLCTVALLIFSVIACCGCCSPTINEGPMSAPYPNQNHVQVFHNHELGRLQPLVGAGVVVGTYALPPPADAVPSFSHNAASFIVVAEVEGIAGGKAPSAPPREYFESFVSGADSEAASFIVRKGDGW